MIELAKTSITIAAPVADVFKYVSNMENYKQWFPDVSQITSANTLEHAVVGKKYKEMLSMPGGEVELEIEVDCCDVNELFLTKGNLEGVLPQMTVTFSVNQDQSCQMNLQYHSRNPALTSTCDIVIALKENLNHRAKIGVANLKSILEKNNSPINSPQI